MPARVLSMKGLGRVGLRCWDRLRHEHADEICVRPPVASAGQLIAPGSIHGDEGRGWLCRMQGHLLTAVLCGVEKREVMNLLPEASTLVLRCDGELTE